MYQHNNIQPIPESAVWDDPYSTPQVTYGDPVQQQIESNRYRGYSPYVTYEGLPSDVLPMNLRGLFHSGTHLPVKLRIGILPTVMIFFMVLMMFLFFA